MGLRVVADTNVLISGLYRGGRPGAVVDGARAAGYASLQRRLIENPQSGALVRGSGGVRKVRWARPGRGKRGGVRVIYYAKVREGVIWMLTIYAKNEAESISPSVLRKIKEEIDG